MGNQCSIQAPVEIYGEDGIQDHKTLSKGPYPFARPSHDVLRSRSWIMVKTETGQGSSTTLLDRLPPDLSAAIQADHYANRIEGTGQWFVRSDLFTDWLLADGGAIWGTGPPGAGKTLWAALVIDQVEKLADGEGAPQISIAYVYCRYITDVASVTDVLLTLVRQQLKRHPRLASIIIPFFLKYEEGNTYPTQAELVELLKAISKEFEKNIFVIEGVDEIKSEDGDFDLVETLSTVENINFFFTSRPLKPSDKKPANVQFFEIAASDEDIDILIANKMEQHPGIRELFNRPGIKDEMTINVRDLSQRLFLHINLILEIFRYCLSVKDIRNTIKRFSGGVNGLYREVMRCVAMQLREYVQVARAMLFWLVDTVEPFTIEDLQYALAFWPETLTFDEDRVIPEGFFPDMCCGLTSSDKETNFIRLSHNTTREGVRSSLIEYHPRPQEEIGRACVARFNTRNFATATLPTVGDLRKLVSETHLLTYAYKNWAFHVQQSRDESPEVWKAAIQFIRDCRSFPFKHEWVLNGFDLQLGPDEAKLDALGSFHVAALYNFPEILDEIAGVSKHESDEPPHERSPSQIDINAPTPEEGITPLMLASACGYEEFVKRLLALPEIQVNLAAKNGQTALTLALTNQHQTIVQLLLGFQGIQVPAHLADKLSTRIL